MMRRIRRILAIGKSMKPDLDRAKTGDGIDLQTAGNKGAGRMTTHILPCRFDNIGLGEHDPALVMIEFQVVGIEIGIFLQVDDTGVVRAKKDAVFMDDAVIEGLVVGLELGIPPLRQPDTKQQRRGNRRDPDNLSIFHPPNYDFGAKLPAPASTSPGIAYFPCAAAAASMTATTSLGWLMNTT
jgi:hypothetical protein